VTDLVILVVAADDGVMPQTVEAINHAKAARVPMIIAINKIDKPDSKPERVRTELLQYEVQVESMGGDVVDVEVSAKNKTNLDKLLEMIALQADLLDLKTNASRPAEGTVIEPSSSAAVVRWRPCWFSAARCGSAISSWPAPRWAASAR
jgi:translation initiation factor IF-2